MLTGLLAKGVGFVAMGCLLGLGFWASRKLTDKIDIYIESHGKAAKEEEAKLVQEMLKQQEQAI